MKQPANGKMKELRKKEKKYADNLTQKRLLLGKSDGAMESRFPTERFELESDIKVLEIILDGIRNEIATLGNHDHDRNCETVPPGRRPGGISLEV